MTIEIKQLVIRAVVEPRREPGADPAPRAGAQRAPTRAARDRAAPERDLDRAALVAACVQETMRELRKRRER